MKKILKNNLIFIVILLSITAFAFQEDNSGDLLNNKFLLAVDNNDENEIYQLLRTGNSVNLKGKFGITPLMRAVFRNNEKITKLLLESGADISAADIGGATALHVASRVANQNIIEILLSYKPNVNLRDKDGWTALMRAVGVKNPVIIKMLLDAGANPEIENNAKQSAITQAILHNNVYAVQLFADRNLLPANKSLQQKLLDLSNKLNYTEISSIFDSKFNLSEILVSPDLRKKPEKEIDQHIVAPEDITILAEGELENASENANKPENSDLAWLDEDNRNQYADYSDFANITDHIKGSIESERPKASNSLITSALEPDSKKLNITENSEQVKSSVTTEEANKNIALNQQDEEKDNKINSNILNNERITESTNSQKLPVYASNNYNQHAGNKIFKKKNIWIEVKFNNYQSALDKYEQIEKIVLSENLGIRLNKSVLNTNKSSIQIGPIKNLNKLQRIYSILNLENNNSKIVDVFNKSRYGG